MKKLVSVWIILIIGGFIACKKEKDYKEEIFIEKYMVIYGNWQYKYSVGESGIIHKEDHTMKFIPIGKFQYNEGTTGTIKILQQDENNLLIDFGSLFPNVSWASIGFTSTGDTMSFAVVNGLYSWYVRVPE